MVADVPVHIALGVSEEKVQKMSPRDVLTMLKYPAKIKR